MKKDFYEILGVSKSATQEEIKKAYRKRAMEHHPDRNPDDKAAEGKFKEAAEAYEILSDEQQRAKYDRYGHQAFEGGGGRGNQQQHAEDIFSSFADMFGGGGRQQQQQRGEQGGNVRIKMKLTLNEIATGVNKKIKINKEINCHSCAGSGAKDRNSTKSCTTCRGSGYVRKVTQTFLGNMQTTVTCPTCSGSGQMITANCGSCAGKGTEKGEEVISVDIPAGVADGMQLSMNGKGHAGRKGGSPGDLVIAIEEIEHEQLNRDGNNLIYELNLNFADAILGTHVVVPTLSGDVKMTIPPNTPAGKVFRLRDKGLPVLQSYEKGDLLVSTNIFIPKDLSADSRSLLEKIRENKDFQPKQGKQERGFMDRMKDLFQ